jgi:hypothetical protein
MTGGWRCRRGGGIDRDGALGCEAVEVAGTAGFGAGAGEAFAAEGLHADDGADHAAVDIAVADPEPSQDWRTVSSMRLWIPSVRP